MPGKCNSVFLVHTVSWLLATFCALSPALWASLHLRGGRDAVCPVSFLPCWQPHGILAYSQGWLETGNSSSVWIQNGKGLRSGVSLGYSLAFPMTLEFLENLTLGKQESHLTLRISEVEGALCSFVVHLPALPLPLNPAPICIGKTLGKDTVCVLITHLYAYRILAARKFHPYTPVHSHSLWRYGRGRE